MQYESEFNKALKEELIKLEYDQVIEWWERLNSGKVETVHGGWMQLAREGTPDWIITFYDKTKHIFILWVEGKSDSGIKKKIAEAQLEFMQHYNSLPGFKVIRTNIVEEIINFIRLNAYDKDAIKFQDMSIHMGLIKLGEEEY